MPRGSAALGSYEGLRGNKHLETPLTAMASVAGQASRRGRSEAKNVLARDPSARTNEAREFSLCFAHDGSLVPPFSPALPSSFGVGHIATCRSRSRTLSSHAPLPDHPNRHQRSASLPSEFLPGEIWRPMPWPRVRGGCWGMLIPAFAAKC